MPFVPAFARSHEPTQIRALLEQIFNKASPISHFRCECYMTAPRVNDKPLLSLAMKDRLSLEFRFPTPVPDDMGGMYACK